MKGEQDDEMLEDLDQSGDPLRRELCGAFGRIAARAVLPPPHRLNINAAA